MHQDPHWPRASAWLAGTHGTARASLAVLGAPLNHSISPGRCDLAPAAIRAAMARYSPYDLEHDRNLDAVAVSDFGDLELHHFTPEGAFTPIRDLLRSALSNADAAVLLGGDNGITRPGVHALGVPLERCGLITLDAHLDLRDIQGGLMNGNPVRALLGDGLPGENIVQIGLQAFANSAAYAQIGRDAGIRYVTAEHVHMQGIDEVVGAALDHLSLEAEAIYFDLDIDVLDRSFAPATPGSRPGGLMPWQARRAAYLCGLHPKVRVMDLVEIDPEHDAHDVTALAAAACLLAFASGLLGRSESNHG